MKKLKLTERQVTFIQQRDKDLAKKKILKINESQYDKLFKGGFNKASKSISKNLKSGGIKEGDENEINPLEFAQELIVFIKDVIANPKRVPFSNYWKALDLTRKELFDLVNREDLLTKMVDEGNVNSYKAKKIGFRRGVKELCKKIVERSHTQLNEFGDAGYPAGAEHDSRAPFNDASDYDDSSREGRKVKNPKLKYIH